MHLDTLPTLDGQTDGRTEVVKQYRAVQAGGCMSKSGDEFFGAAASVMAVTC